MNDQTESYTINVSPVRIVAHYFLTYPDGRIVDGQNYDTEAEAMIALAARLAGQGYNSDISLCVQKGYYRTFAQDALQLDRVAEAPTDTDA